MKTIHDLLREFEGLPAALDRNLKIGIGMAAQEAASRAKSTHGYIDRSGTLTSSIGVDGPTGTFSQQDLKAVVSGGAKYTRYVEEGTRAHVIKPRYRKALRFPGGAGFIFARGVKHPGTKPTMFLHNAVEVAIPAFIEKTLPDVIDLSFAQCRLSLKP